MFKKYYWLEMVIPLWGEIPNYDQFKVASVVSELGLGRDEPRGSWDPERLGLLPSTVHPALSYLVFSHSGRELCSVLSPAADSA